MSKSKNNNGQVVPSDIVKTDDIQFRPPQHKPSVYQPVLDAIKSMKKGQSITIPVAANVEPRQIQNRLSSAMRNQNILPPEGCVFTKRMTVDNKLAISVVAGEPAPKKGGKKKSAK